MSEEKVQVYGYGIGVMYADPESAEAEGLHDSMIDETDLLGYDDHDGVRYYFYLTPRTRDKLHKLVTIAGALGTARACVVIRQPELFTLR